MNAVPVESAAAPWAVPAPAPRAAWHRYRVVLTVEIEARTSQEALELASAARDTSYAGEVTVIEDVAAPAPYSAHPEEWREAMGAAVDPDEWFVRSVPDTSWRWLTDGAVALRLPDGEWREDAEVSQAMIEVVGPYQVVRPERSTRATDPSAEPCVQLGRAVVQRRYAWLVERLFPGVSWMAATALDPVRAFSGGDLVALVMPLEEVR